MNETTILEPNKYYMISIKTLPHWNDFDITQHPMLFKIPVVYIGEDTSHYTTSHIFARTKFMNMYDFKNEADVYAFHCVINMCTLYIDEATQMIRFHIRPDKYTLHSFDIHCLQVHHQSKL